MYNIQRRGAKQILTPSQIGISILRENSQNFIDNWIELNLS